MYTPTLAFILSLQYLFFYIAQLKCVKPLTQKKTIVSVIKEGCCIVCFYYILRYFFKVR